MSDLNVENFVKKIKEMTERERKKVSKEELINLIILLPDEVSDVAKYVELTAAINYIRTRANTNAAEILLLKSSNDEILKENETLKTDILTTNESIKGVKDKINGHESHLNGIEQYLRVNNLEIVGIPPPEHEGDSIEETLVEIFNSLPELNSVISPNDIDICHIMPSDRKDKKLVAVCKFIHRKSKFNILEAKRKSRNFKYKDHDIFINDHLSQPNRHLFATAALKKKELNYRFLWTRNGAVFMRENERSSVFKIDTVESLNNLVRTVPENTENDE